jgi:cytoskeletal protein CcmA (bactofilin family)
MKNGVMKQEKTYINNLTYIIGAVKVEEDLIINGNVKGNVYIRNHDLFLGPGGRIKGNIYGKDIIIKGQMKGEIQASGKVEITRKAKFSGKIKCKSVSVEKGAYFDAYVNLGQQSPENETSGKASIAKPAP